MDEQYCTVFMYLIFFIYSSVLLHLGCFRVLAIVSTMAMIVGMQVSFSILVFFRSTPRREIIGSHGSCANCGVGEDSWEFWTARRSNQSIIKEISHEYSLEGLMLKQASDLASNCLDTALTVSALTACSECKTCGTADKIMDKSWNCWAPEVGLADQAPGLTAFHLQDKTNSINMKPELQFAHRLMKASVSVLGLSAGTLNWNLWTHTHRVDLLPGTFSQLGLQMCCDLGLPRAIWVWMLVRTQFDDVASAVFISVFF